MYISICCINKDIKKNGINQPYMPVSLMSEVKKASNNNK